MDLENLKNLTIDTLRRANLHIMQNYTEIDQAVAEKLYFFNFSRWRPAPCTSHDHCNVTVIGYAGEVVDSKAARCLFDESLIRSMYDLEKLTELGRQTKIKLNIDPPLYGRCCYNRFDPVNLILSHALLLQAPTAYCILHSIWDRGGVYRLLLPQT